MENEESPNNNWVFNLVAGIISFAILSHILAAKGYPLIFTLILVIIAVWLASHITRKAADYLDSRQRRNF